MLKKIYICSFLLFMLCSFFGPYKWKIYSYEGLLVYFLFQIVFFAGLSMRKISLKSHSRHHTICCFNLTKQGKAIIYFFQVLSILCFLYEIIFFFKTLGEQYRFLGGQYNSILYDQRTIVNKLANFMLQSGMAGYIIIHVLNIKQSKMAKLLGEISFWCSPLKYLMAGTRFEMAVAFFIYFYLNSIKVQNTRVCKKQKYKNIIKLLLLGLLIFLAFMYLFSTRLLKVSHYTMETIYEFVPGDSPLKPWAQDLYNITHGLISPIYSLFNYMGEAPFVFAKFWKDFYPEKVYFGGLSFQPIYIVLRFFGIPQLSPGEIWIETIQSYFKYSGMGFALIIDFGFLIGVGVTFIVGVIMAKIEKFNQINVICRCLYPCFVPLCFFAPVQTFYVGRTDYIIFWTLILCFVLYFFRSVKRIYKV